MSDSSFSCDQGDLTEPKTEAEKAERAAVVLEESHVFFDLIKWLILAVLIGSIAGLLSSFFLYCLEKSMAWTGRYPYYFLFLPAAMFLGALIDQYIVPSADVHTTDKVIEYLHDIKDIPPFSIVKAFVLPILTIAFGGSAGKEAPAADVGAAAGSLIGRLLRMSDEDKRKLTICGISGGFAAIFGTPIGGALFGIEVLFVGSLLYDILFPAFVAGIVGYQVSTAFGMHYFYYPIQFAPVFSRSFFSEVVLAGVFFGLCSRLLIRMKELVQEYNAKMRLWQPLKSFVGGAFVALTGFLSLDYLRLGLDTIQSSVQGGHVPWYSPFMKMLVTSVTLGMGGSGGIVTPVFFIGATAGHLFARIFHLDPGTFAAIGMVSLLAGTTNVPIAASVLAVELFGGKIASYAALTCIISYAMTGRRSVYPSQELSVKKYASMRAEWAGSVKKIRTLLRIRPGD